MATLAKEIQFVDLCPRVNNLWSYYQWVWNIPERLDKKCLFIDITSTFTLWWSDKLTHESKYINNVLFSNVNYSLLRDIKYCLYYNIVVYSHGDQRKIPYANNNTVTNNIVLIKFSNPILTWHTQHTNISHTSTHTVLTSRR
jgi:hypothetical protein